MSQTDMRRAKDIENSFATDLMRSMRCGLMTVDAQGRVGYCNEMAASILELEDEEMAGKPIRAVVSAHAHLAELLATSATLATPPDRAEMEIRLRGGRMRTIGFSLSQVCGEDGSVRGAAFFFKDLTPIEHKEQQERLQERLAALGTMAASLAHEIRNPLAALEVTTTLLRRRMERAGQPMELLETLQEQVRRLSGTVTTSLEYVRPLALNPAPFDLARLLDEAVESAAPVADDARIRVVRHYAALRPTMNVDGPRLREALTNLVRNAMEAMADNGGVLKLEISTPDAAAGLTGANVVIRVTDTGGGISAEIRSKIFNPFFSTKPQGSGLGLAWSRKVVDAHGGVLDVNSQEGEGTSFTLRLPLPSVATTPEIVTTGETLHEASDSGC